MHQNLGPEHNFIQVHKHYANSFNLAIVLLNNVYGDMRDILHIAARLASYFCHAGELFEET